MLKRRAQREVHETQSRLRDKRLRNISVTPNVPGGFMPYIAKCLSGHQWTTNSRKPSFCTQCALAKSDEWREQIRKGAKHD